MPGWRSGSPGADGGVVQVTMPWPWMMRSPVLISMSSVTSVPGGSGSRVRTKIPPREMLRA
jgi:hypothetical protein